MLSTDISTWQMWLIFPIPWLHLAVPDLEKICWNRHGHHRDRHHVLDRHRGHLLVHRNPSVRIWNKWKGFILFWPKVQFYRKIWAVVKWQLNVCGMWKVDYFLGLISEELWFLESDTRTPSFARWFSSDRPFGAFCDLPFLPLESFRLLRESRSDCKSHAVKRSWKN